MDRIERIKRMEVRLNRVSAVLQELEKALETYKGIEEDLQILSDYYGSREWKEDFEADEAGLLPKELKRGVLSEDGIDEVLQSNAELHRWMNALSK